VDQEEKENMSSTEKDLTDVTAAFCKCKRAVFIGVTHMLDKASKKEVGELAVAGYDIKHITVDEARLIDFGCECPEKEENKNGELFEQ
jgi:hypothetical protein